jgi:hypothetical protein
MPIGTNCGPTESLPCIVCRKVLEDAVDPPSQGNQPYPGLEFTTHGHYGSTIFDMEPGILVVNICDDCVTAASRDDIVRIRTNYRYQRIDRFDCVDAQWKSPKA